MAATSSQPHSLEREFAFYNSHKAALDVKYRGKFIVINGEEISGPFDNQGLALREGLKRFKPGTFLIQQCGDDSSQVQYFHSRVAFH